MVRPAQYSLFCLVIKTRPKYERAERCLVIAAGGHTQRFLIGSISAFLLALFVHAIPDGHGCRATPLESV